MPIELNMDMTLGILMLLNVARHQKLILARNTIFRGNAVLDPLPQIEAFHGKNTNCLSVAFLHEN